MGDEFLELECKLLKATLDRMMRINEAYQLKSMFTHAVDRLELIFRIRYKKLLEREIQKETIELLNTYCKNDDAAIQIENLRSYNLLQGGQNNETSDS